LTRTGKNIVLLEVDDHETMRRASVNGLVDESAVPLAVGFDSQCQAQSVPLCLNTTRSLAAQAIGNDAVRPKLASQMLPLFVDKPSSQHVDHGITTAC